MTNQSATRIAAGFYEYSGFDIVSEHIDGYGASWFITPASDGPHEDNHDMWMLDPTSTLRGAKEVIDHINQGEA